MKAKTGTIFFALLLFQQCTPSSNSKQIDMEAAPIIQYLSEVHSIGIDSLSNTIIYFYPLGGCETCERLNGEMLVSTPPSTHLLIMCTGSPSAASLNLVSKVKEAHKRQLYEGETMELWKRSIDASKPTLLHIAEGDIVYLKKVNDPEIHNAQQYILENLYGEAI